MPDATRIKAPPRISLSIESLDNGQAYWARIDGREDENSLGRLNVSILDREIRVDTDNVDAYTLFLENAPLDGDPEVHIVENGTPLGHTRDPVFTRRTPKYEGAVFVKHARLHGPIGDAFTDRYAILWGGGSRGRTDSGPNQSVAEALAKGAPAWPAPRRPRTSSARTTSFSSASPRSRTGPPVLRTPFPSMSNRPASWFWAESSRERIWESS